MHNSHRGPLSMTVGSCRSKEFVCRQTVVAMQFLLFTFALLLIAVPGFSQASQGTIQGGVFDQTGGAVAGASVAVIDVARGITRSLMTDDAGQYVANSLTPG